MHLNYQERSPNPPAPVLQATVFLTYLNAIHLGLRRRVPWF